MEIRVRPSGLFLMEVTINLGKLFDIVPTTKASRRKKYPYKIKFSDGRIVPVPSQHDFADKFIQNHGCDLWGKRNPWENATHICVSTIG